MSGKFEFKEREVNIMRYVRQTIVLCSDEAKKKLYESKGDCWDQLNNGCPSGFLDKSEQNITEPRDQQVYAKKVRWLLYLFK